MISLFIIVLTAELGGASVTASAQEARTGLAQFVAEASQTFGMPAAWIYAVMSTESDNQRRALSAKGAMGLMQLMPGTWQVLSAKYDLGNDPYDPRANILAGSAYLRDMYDRFGPAGFLAAYNAGPGRYEKWLQNGFPLPQETLDYVAKIAAKINLGEPIVANRQPPAPQQLWTNAPLFSEPASDEPDDQVTVQLVPRRGSASALFSEGSVFSKPNETDPDEKE